ncbi:MAG: hypothetical protein HYR60_32410 [Acidobacteria bacterium]|nr:hypothetical protein [Acidobacteriota bacterium]MBI3471728.1 hypothetical protein [Candidatus Solibacter usitatus]
MKRYLFILLAAAALLGANGVPDAAKDKAEITLREIFAFAPGGVIEINDSFGDLHVEGWDQADVEITTIRATRKEYLARDHAKAMQELERVVITPAKPSDDRFVITTEFPGRNLFTRPLRGKTNLEVEYRIKVPRHSNLSIKHDIGEVKVTGVAGNVEVTSRIGEVTLRLPGCASYRIDARSKIGDVHSDLEGWSQRRLLVGEQFESDPPVHVRRVYVRVGIGEINLRKMPATTSRAAPPEAVTL